ncbi:MAG: transglycosylase domain-containing protein [Propioniciclava sp.]
MAEPKRKRTAGRVILSFFKWVGALAILFAILGAAAFAILYVTIPIPNANEDFQTNISTAYYRDGETEIGSFAVQNRESIPLADMSPEVRDAIVAAEDQTFWTNSGISFIGLTRVFQTAITPGADQVGGSTMTQQYVKVLYLTQEQTVTRKLKEIIISLKVAQELSKEEILQGYLNTVYFGRGAYGIQAASQTYFRLDADELNLQQSIALAAIVNSPENLDPAKSDKHRSDLLERYQYTINEMVTLGTLTEAQKAEIYTTLPDFPKFADTEGRYGGTKGYLLAKVEKELAAAGLTEAEIRGGGLKIVTTVDADMQASAVESAQEAAYRAANPRGLDPATLHPAIASVDVATGAILAMYGGPDYVADNRNWAETPRPTGSTFKPWALVAGLRDGATLGDYFNGNTYTPRGDRDPVTNAGHNYGPVTLKKATTSSINTAYVDLVSQMQDGPEKVIKAANDVGIPDGTDWRSNGIANHRIALGTAQVSPLDAAHGLSTLTNGGKRTTLHIVSEAHDLVGRQVYEAPVSTKQMIEPDVAQNAVYALNGVTEQGTGRTVRSLGYPVAGKTGTYYVAKLRETRASWFIGSTAQISTAVMFVAGDQGTSNLEEYARGFYGSGFPAETWLAYMKVAQKDLSRVNFPGPTTLQRSGKFGPRPTAPKPRRAPVEKPASTPASSPEPEVPGESPEPEEPPVDPGEPPINPGEPPVDPVDPINPVDPPVDPVEPPVDPVEPPVDPVEPPVDPPELPEPQEETWPRQGNGQPSQGRDEAD